MRSSDCGTDQIIKDDVEISIQVRDAVSLSKEYLRPRSEAKFIEPSLDFAPHKRPSNGGVSGCSVTSALELRDARGVGGSPWAT